MVKLSTIIISFLALHNFAFAADLGNETQRASGKKLYDKYCAQCHGDTGNGSSPASERFMPRPRDFTKGKYKVRTTLSGSLPTDSDIHRAIRSGLAFNRTGAYTAMPPWPQLSDDEIKNLVYYIKSFSADFADPEYNNPKVVNIPAAIPSSPESIKKGRAVFEKNECIKCHGNLGYGNGNSAPTLEDDWGNHIRPANLAQRWTFRAGSSREDVYRTISTGFNGTPMPSYMDNISEEDRWHLVNYLFSLSEYDTPNYTQSNNPVMLTPIQTKIDLSNHEQAEKLFDAASEAKIPVAGQVIEPGREFYASANEIRVRAIYNDEHAALMLRWYDMSAETSGANSPDMEVASTEVKKVESEGEKDPFADEESESEDPFAEEESGSAFSDAVAIQLPHEKQSGYKLPYFIFGDAENSVDLWHVDLATKQPKLWVGRGSADIKIVDAGDLTASTRYHEGEWTVIFKRARKVSSGISFDSAGEFTPIAFSVWDGFNEERGNKRGITAWFYLYQEPTEKPSMLIPMVSYGVGLLLLELLFIFLIRRNSRSS